MREELLASRDRAIGLEAELGEALGRARELEAELGRYQFAARELEHFRRSAVWRIYEPYGRFRGRIGSILRRILVRLR